MSGFIAVREPSYRGPENAVKYMKDAGIHHLELSLRPEDELQKIVADCRDAGINISSLAGPVDLDSDESIEDARDIANLCGDLEIPIWFCSVKGAELQREEHMKRLAALGDDAAATDTIISMETHPPFCHNADEMLKTIEDTDHENIRINFDTANIYYYNENIDSPDELERVVDYVASLHLKDTQGGYQSNDFPIFGRGIVDFERILRILENAEFQGPMTIELEGPAVAELDAEGRHGAIKECVKYLKSVGMT